MKVGVFGGSGFIGSYLVPTLFEKGYDVISLDIQPSKYPQPASFIQLDILDEKAVNDVFEKQKFDIVFNLAGFANLDKAITKPLETIQLNVVANMYILEACVQYNIKRFVYASSAYAMSDKGSFYGISKLSSEKIIEEYSLKKDLNYTILRYGSLYSERDFENNYIYNLVKKAIDTGKIVHDGDGNEIREYIHASDAAKLSVEVIENDQYINKHLVLTGVERLKRVELFNLIKEILGDKIDVKLSNDGYHNHYKYSPYSFTPEQSQKLIPNPYIDMGQGILNCIKEVYKK